MTASGTVVRLAGIDTPAGAEGKTYLSALITGQHVRMTYDADTPDRYNRFVAQVYLSDGTWLQGKMLERGLAMTDSSDRIRPADRDQAMTLERSAQNAHLGLWATKDQQVVSPEETAGCINQYKIVEGVVVSVNPWHDSIYINFSHQWKGHFSLYIPRKYAGDFSRDALNALVGKKIRVRGWIRYHNAPSMDITQPDQIEKE